MGLHNSKIPEPKLTFRNFSYHTEVFQTEKAQQEKSRSILSKGEALAGKIPGCGTELGYILKALNFLISQNSLESALVEAKINESVAINTAWALKCKIRAIGSSLTILQGRITDPERFVEIRLAENTCREVLNTFSVDGCLKNNALDSSAVLFPFSTIYVEVIKTYWFLEPSPDIKTHLKNAANQLLTTLKDYRDSAIQSRMNKIRDCDTHAVAGRPVVFGYEAVDDYRKDFRKCHGEFERRLFQSYRDATRSLYVEFFNQFVESSENLCQQLQ